MAFATAQPNEYLVVGQGGIVTNRGTGIRIFLWPGSTWVLIPATKQEALFEMTQETRDGVPLHFKGIVIYKISDPIVAAMSFNFSDEKGIEEINSLISNICRGELRAVVSGMTMNECIEKRKEILTVGVDRALRQIVFSQEKEAGRSWGIEIELVQVAQVYITDTKLRSQLEAEVRNEILAKSEQSDIRTREGIRLAQIASERQVQEQTQVTEKDAIRQKEELELANLQVHRRLAKQKQEAQNEAIQLGVETFKLNEEAARVKAEVETPVRLLQLEKLQVIRRQELELAKADQLVREQEVNRDMLIERARQELRKEILPLEQIPQIAESLSNTFKGSKLSVWGSDNQIFASILPLLGALSDVVKGAMEKATEENIKADPAQKKRPL